MAPRFPSARWRAPGIAVLAALAWTVTHPVGGLHGQDQGAEPEESGGLRGAIERLFEWDPLGPSIDVGVGLSPSVMRGRIELTGRFGLGGSPLFLVTRARYSQLDVVHFYGLGNATEAVGDRSFHRVDHDIAAAALGIGVAAGDRFSASAGMTLDRSSTSAPADGYFQSLDPLYGSGVFVQAGLFARVVLDPLARSDATAYRIRLLAEGALYPRVFSTRETTGTLSLEASTLLATSLRSRFALRLKGRVYTARGPFPWYRAAFLGGTRDLLGWHRQRFAGDTSLFTSAELRVRVLTRSIFVPVDIGLVAFTDAGHVRLDGRRPGGWHSAYGGGVYAHPVGDRLLFSALVAAGDQAKVYLLVGLPY